jgi:phosphatidylinositol alpha-mannosyltransferase
VTERVLLISPYSFDVYGGVQQQVDGIATALARTGAEVAVVAPSLGVERDRNGYRFIPGSRSISVPTNGSRAPVAPTPAAFLATRRTLARFDPTILHVHEPLAPGLSIFSLWAYHGPIVGTFHRSRAGWVYPIYGRLNSLAQRKITVGVAVSAAAAQTATTALGRSFPDPVIVPNGIDARAIGGAVRSAAPRPVLLFVGRHEPRKGLEILLAAFCALEEDLELQVIGDGGETDRLRRRYDDRRIVWLGRVDEAEKHRRLAAANVFVAPSLGGESFGVVLLEAMAAKAAVIASDLPGYREAGGSVVLYVRANDPVALRSTIRTLLESPAEMDRRGTLGLQRSAQFDFALIAERYLELYERAVRDHAQPRDTQGTLRRLKR